MRKAHALDVICSVTLSSSFACDFGGPPDPPRTGDRRLYALVEAGDPKAIDVYLSEQDAQRALEDASGIRRELLRVEEIELGTVTIRSLSDAMNWSGEGGGAAKPLPSSSAR